MSYAAPPKRWFIRAFGIIHWAVFRLSGGRLSNSLQGDEICFLETTGAKTGKVRKAPLMYVPYEQGVLMVASVGGTEKHPFWYWNILKNPEVIVTHRNRRMRLKARLATPEEKPRVWPICVQAYPPFAEYQTRTKREIPVFVAEPMGA
ncbi:MAG: nitroreductase family deazaflavin-dependent oxidoreductase [Myxococcales bacterium]|nr:nitroreductase family deazaflavin-dependent oxidoreductase [Myxococcales bacterium]